MPRRIATHPGKITGFKGVRGRPPSNVGRYLLRPSARERTGYTVENATPQVMQDAKDYYLKAGQMPLSLRSSRTLYPEVLRKQKNESISKGFNKQKSFQG